MEPLQASASTTADAPARRPLAPRRRAGGVPGGAIALIVFGVVLLTGLWVTMTGRIHEERAEAVEAEFGRNTNLALALDVQTQQLIQGIDQFLVLMRHQAEHAPPRVPLTELVAPAFAGTRNITLMGVFDERGDVLESVSEFTATNAADRPMFQYHRDNPSRDLLVSPPLTRSRASRRPPGGTSSGRSATRTADAQTGRSSRCGGSTVVVTLTLAHPVARGIRHTSGRTGCRMLAPVWRGRIRHPHGLGGWPLPRNSCICCTAQPGTAAWSPEVGAMAATHPGPSAGSRP